MNRFKQKREELGLSAEQVAAEIGTTVGSVYSWERGDTRPHIDNVVKLAKLYDVSVDWLVGKDD